MKHAHFKLRRLARAALGIIGAAAILLAALGPALPVAATPLFTSYYTEDLGQFGDRWHDGGWAMYELILSHALTSNLQGVYVKNTSTTVATGWTEMGPGADDIWPNSSGTNTLPGDWCIYVSGADVTGTCDAGETAAGGSAYSHQGATFDLTHLTFSLKLDPWGGGYDNTTEFATLQVWAIYSGSPPPTATPTPTATPNNATQNALSTQDAAATQTALVATGNATQIASATAAAGATQTAAAATQTAGPGATQTRQAETATPGGPQICFNDGYPNCVRNGNFENAYPGGQALNWDSLLPGGGLAVDQSVFTTGNGGPAYCGTHYMNINGNGVNQRVLLPQGTLYLNLRIRTKLDPAPFPVYPQVEIVQAGSTPGAAGTSWTVVNGKGGETMIRGLPADNGWETVQQAHPMLIPEAEYFDIHLYNVAYLPGYWYYTGSVMTWIPPSWALQQNPDQDFQVDDFFISTSGYKTFCMVAGGPTGTPNSAGTATPTPAITPTPTATTIGAATATATGTSSPAPATTFFNCDFEQGMSGWVGNNASVLLEGGPIGPQFLRVNGSGGFAQQPFTWPGGPAYFTFWIGPGSGGNIQVVGDNGVDDVLWSQSESTPAWKLVRVTLPTLTPGNYQLKIYGNDFVPMDVDGVLPAANGYAYCGSGSTEVTPTSGPTSYVTPTPTASAPFPSSTAVTLTPHATVPTNTPNATWTASPTYSPMPTQTPNVAATETMAPQETATQAYYASATAAQSTATALGTPAATINATATSQQAASQTQGANATATAEGAPPSPSPMPNPPQNVEPAPGADCQRPDNPWNLAWWADYEVCRTLTWFLWTPDNTQQIISIQQQLTDYEPIGTLAEINVARDTLQAMINQYDWTHTGIETGLNTDMQVFFPSSVPNGLLSGNLNLAPGNDTFQFVTTCSIQLTNSFGDAMAKGFCASINWLQVTGILGWMQFFFDVVVWVAFIRYAWHFITNIVPNLL
jgi:hypothetical protein